MKDINPLLDNHFDDLAYTLIEPSKPRIPRPTPHCDCRKSNEVFFGGKIRNRDADPNWSYTMVPVVATANGDCPHCGHFAVLLQPQDGLQSNARKNRERAQRELDKGKWTVVGTHTETGETKTFSSAKEAYENGCGCVLTAMKHDRALRGWRWQRVAA